MQAALSLPALIFPLLAQDYLVKNFRFTGVETQTDDLELALSKRTVQYWLWYKIFSSCSNGSAFNFNRVLCSHFEVERQIPSVLVPLSYHLFESAVLLSTCSFYHILVLKTALLHAHSLPLKSFHQFQFKNAHFVFHQFARSLVLSWLCFSQATCLKNNRNLFFRPPAVFCLHYSVIPCCSVSCYDFFFDCRRTSRNSLQHKYFRVFQLSICTQALS